MVSALFSDYFNSFLCTAFCSLKKGVMQMKTTRYICKFKFFFSLKDPTFLDQSHLERLDLPLHHSVPRRPQLHSMPHQPQLRSRLRQPLLRTVLLQHPHRLHHSLHHHLSLPSPRVCQVSCSPYHYKISQFVVLICDKSHMYLFVEKQVLYFTIEIFCFYLPCKEVLRGYNSTQSFCSSLCLSDTCSHLVIDLSHIYLCSGLT